MQCGRCGNHCPEESRFCPRCGERLHPDREPSLFDSATGDRISPYPATNAGYSSQGAVPEPVASDPYPPPWPGAYPAPGEGANYVAGGYADPLASNGSYPAESYPPSYPYPQGRYNEPGAAAGYPSPAYPQGTYADPATGAYQYPAPLQTGYNAAGGYPVAPYGGYLPAQSYGPQRFIERYYSPDQLVTASAGRRFGAAMLDIFLACITLFVGWLIWFCFTAPNGQTPAKQLLGMYVMREDGTRAGGWYTWLREWLIKGIFSVTSFFTVGLIPLVAAAWCLWDRDKQCLWDKLGSTYVAHSPNGFKPITRTEAQQGLLPR